MALYDNRPRAWTLTTAPDAQRTAKQLLLPVMFFISGGLLALNLLEPSSVELLRSSLAARLTPMSAQISETALFTVDLARAAWTRAVRAVETKDAAPSDVRARANLQMRIDDLERENRDLKALTQYARSPKPAIVAARVVMSSPSPISHMLVIDAGLNQGVRAGHPVVSGNSLVGRVLQTYEDQATVMLLTDRLSRIPVYVGGSQTRAVLVGSDGGGMRLEFVGPGNLIAPGDLVTTSGVGGVFPRGLGIGVVADGDVGSHDPTRRVQLTADPTDPLAVGVLLIDGGAYDDLVSVTTRSERTLGQSSIGRDPPVSKDRGGSR